MQTVGLHQQEASVAAVEVVAAVAEVVEAAAAVVEVAAAVVLVEVQPRSVEALVVSFVLGTFKPIVTITSGIRAPWSSFDNG
ncbi:unnamed protein product [Closterium sp. NIES-54]